MPPAPSGHDNFRNRADQALLVLYASVGENVGWATAALLDQDRELAERVIASDVDIDERCRDLTGLVKDRLGEVAFNPEELEDLIAILQIVPELERSADLAEHIAQRARDGLGGAISPRARGLIQQMCDTALRLWQQSARAYAERSRDIIFELNELDDELDNLSAKLASEGGTAGVEPGVAAELALIARFYERVGDHAVNLGRRAAEMSAPRRMSPLRSLRDRWQDNSPETDSQPQGNALVRRLRRMRILPTDSMFFQLFSESGSLARRASDELLQAMSDMGNIEEHFKRIRALEREGDQITVSILRRLDASFVTPYDREDIHALAEQLDDVLDDLFAVIALVQQVHVDSTLPEVKQQAEILASMAAEMDGLISCLQSKTGARHRLERIEALEREGDAVMRRCMGRLFSGEYEPLEVLKWKDIVQTLEDAMNAIEDVADVVESILVKES
ncbi:MAG TPA: DUF47 family protein [Acidimicrobiales bacterium]|jgi:predicted phosphate transport protein (TIGR00153 family)|nr:DUF47 family protein [Acidimicrobiales bacterium]